MTIFLYTLLWFAMVIPLGILFGRYLKRENDRRKAASAKVWQALLDREKAMHDLEEVIERANRRFP